MSYPTTHEWNNPESRRLRPAFALAAAFATVAVLGLAVVTPATQAPEVYAVTPTPVEVAILPGTIEVIATRTKAAAAPTPYLPATWRPRG